MSYQFQLDAMKRSQRRVRDWYKNNLLKVLHDAKEKQVRGTTHALVMAHELMEILNAPVLPPRPPPALPPRPPECADVMRPVPAAERDLLVRGPESQCTETYLRQRNKRAPEDKYYYRDVSSWSYGWRQRDAPARRDAYHGRAALLRETFYRKRDLRPDPPHYAAPAGGEVSICSMYSCSP